MNESESLIVYRLDQLNETVNSLRAEMRIFSDLERKVAIHDQRNQYLSDRVADLEQWREWTTRTAAGSILALVGNITLSVWNATH